MDSKKNNNAGINSKNYDERSFKWATIVTLTILLEDDWDGDGNVENTKLGFMRNLLILFDIFSYKSATSRQRIRN